MISITYVGQQVTFLQFLFDLRIYRFPLKLFKMPGLRRLNKLLPLNYRSNINVVLKSIFDPFPI